MPPYGIRRPISDKRIRRPATSTRQSLYSHSPVKSHHQHRRYCCTCPAVRSYCRPSSRPHQASSKPRSVGLQRIPQRRTTASSPLPRRAAGTADRQRHRRPPAPHLCRRARTRTGGPAGRSRWNPRRTARRRPRAEAKKVRSSSRVPIHKKNT